MTYPIVIKNAVPLDTYLAILDELDCSNWTLSNISNPGKNEPVFWSVPEHEKSRLIYFQAASILKLKIMRHLKRDLTLYRIQVNGQTSGQVSRFHEDSPVEGTVTCVLFTAREWDSEWGGEFTLYSPEEDCLKYAPYKLNTAAFFPANWPHRGQSPNHSTHALRGSVAFSYCPSELTEQFSRYPDYSQFIC